MMEHLSTASVPEPGQLVDVRHRRFVVSDVKASDIPADMEEKQRPMHLVTLSSVEDDALGEELQVFWEIEPGLRVFEKAALPAPDGFDPPFRLDAFLDAVRWGVISSADIQALQSPFRSGIEIEDYQLDPVVRALRMPRVNLLIADDVGLGKTIEAGLVIQELLLRYRARTVLVICPASLQIQWQTQMQEKFGLEFRIVDSQMMKSLRRERGLHVNPWSHFPRLITSMDFIKRDRPMRLFKELLPPAGEPCYPRPLDLLIVDEAHNVAPAGTGNYAIPSQRTHAVTAIAPYFEHRLFLTATPHNGYPESFSALLEMLDNQRFARAVRPTQEQLAAIMVRRLKTDLPPRWDGTPRFPRRELCYLEVAYTQTEQKAHRDLKAYSRQLRKHFSDPVGRQAAEFVLKLLKKRLFSSPAAFFSTLHQHIATLKRQAEKPRARFRRPSPGILKQRLEAANEDYADDDAYEEGMLQATETATALFSQLGQSEKALLDQLSEYAQAAQARADSKAEALINWLDQTVRPQGKWNQERVLIFTEYRDTQKWLHDLLVSRGFTGDKRLMLIYGGMETRERERIKAAFQAGPDQSPVRVLLATDAASEGVDLQNHCHRLIHYEIPWNPNRLEQRNGRLDRHGQRADRIEAYHFVAQGFEKTRANASPGDLAADLEFLMRAALKVDQIREDLGKVGPVIAGQVEAAMLGKRTGLDTRKAEAEAQTLRRQLKVERDTRKQVEKLHKQLQSSRTALRVSPENIRAVVSVALELAGQPGLVETELPGLWPDAQGQHQRPPVFKMPALEGAWARCAEGLAHPHTGVIRPITFDHNLAQGRDDVVLVHLNHRLVQMATRLLRAEIWASEWTRRIHRVTARIVPNTALETVAAIAHARLVVLGRDHHRLHEEIIAAGGLIREGRFKRMNVSQTEAALDSVTPAPVPEPVQKRIQAMWDRIESPLFKALEARMKERTQNLQAFLDERAGREIADMTAILSQLAETLSQTLDTSEPAQLSLWPDAEKEQFRRNQDALSARLARIPQEIEQETEAIIQKYAEPWPRMFPVAVSFLVPEKLAV